MTPETAPTDTKEILTTIRFPAVPAGSCSAFNDGNLAGTAPRARGWLALEQPGSWGKNILDGTAISRELAQKISSKIKKETGYKLLLIRQPAGGDTHLTDGRRVFIAESSSTSPTLWTFTVTSPEELLHLPLDKPAHIPGAQRWEKQAVTLICAHSKRDRCCALRGRPIASYLARLRPRDTVWECSHIGGHRYAPTGLLLPSGYVYGRLNPESALAATISLEEHHLPTVTGLRGHSSLSSVDQAAEIAVRQLLLDSGEEPKPAELFITNNSPHQEKKHRAKYLSRRLKYGEASLEELIELNRLNAEYHKARAEKKATQKAQKRAKTKTPQKTADPAATTESRGRHVLVNHRDGRRWSVRIETQKTDPVPTSCGKKPTPEKSLEILGIKPLDPHGKNGNAP